MRGRKPKPRALHLIEGTVNVTRHGDRAEEPEPTGRPKRPSFVRGTAKKIWNEYVEIGFWLTSAESHKLAAWCCMTVELQKGIDKMTSSRIGQWRALGSDLGFDPSARSRLGVQGVVKSAIGKSASPASKYFTTKNEQTG